MKNLQKLLIITPYPQKGTTYGNKFSALASFALNKINAFRKIYPQLKIKVLADKIKGEKNYNDGKLTVQRTWNRSDHWVFLKLLYAIFQDPDAKDILIELEWGLFGNRPFLISLIPFFIGLLRLMKKKVYIVSHGVLLDFNELSPAIGLRKESWISKIYQIGISVFYFLLLSFSDNVIVTEQYLADKLNQKYHTNKVIFIPHGVDTHLSKISIQSARTKIGLPKNSIVIMCFGFLNWYKGSDKIAELFTKYMTDVKKSNIYLVFAGGESYIHKNDPVYRSFITDIKKLQKNNRNIITTGFISEEKIPVYISAADVLLLPYRLLLSSSGPMSLAFSFEKPILLSKNLTNYFDSRDFKKALKLTKIKVSDVIFNFSVKSLKRKIMQLTQSDYSQKMIKFSRKMREVRDWDKIIINYYNLIYKS